jgi:hypothetical protein
VHVGRLDSPGEVCPLVPTGLSTAAIRAACCLNIRVPFHGYGDQLPGFAWGFAGMYDFGAKIG